MSKLFYCRGKRGICERGRYCDPDPEHDLQKCEFMNGAGGYEVDSVDDIKDEDKAVPVGAVSIVVTDVIRDIFNELGCEMHYGPNVEDKPTLVIRKDRFEAIRDKYIPKEEV